MLRVMPIDQFERKKTEFCIIQEMYSRDVLVARPITFGQCDDLNVCYYVLSYIEGRDAEESISEYATNVQFAIGVQAGKDLRKMHEYQAPSHIAPWYGRILKKYRAYVEAYNEIGIKIKDSDKLIEFIERSEPLLKNRPNRFQHDDFHVGNIIVNKGHYAGTIDFNRFDWGDPMHDFVKIGFFSSQVSVPFSVGQLQGYFQNGKIAEHFWRLYSVYTAMTVFSSIVWTTRVAPDTMDGMMERIHRVLEDHRYFESMEPSWYGRYAPLGQELNQ